MIAAGLFGLFLINGALLEKPTTGDYDRTGSASQPDESSVPAAESPPSAAVAMAPSQDSTQIKLRVCAKFEKDIERLECFDHILESLDQRISGESVSEASAHLIAVDQYLADKMKDPTSVTQYRVTSMFECKLLFSEAARDSAKPGKCACWAVNAKNSYGAYNGVLQHYGFLREVRPNVWEVTATLEVKSAQELDACTDAVFVSRDSEKVKIQIK
jgi:hypothetical protein